MPAKLKSGKRSSKSGGKGSVSRKSGESGSSDVGNSPPPDKTSEKGLGESPRGDSTGVTPPTPPPGPPPVKKRGRRSLVDIEAEKSAVETKRIADDQAKRDEQARQVAPILSKSLTYLSRVLSTDEKNKKWAMTPEEVDAISGSTACVLAKYVDLDALNRWKEELALAIALGSYVACRVDFSPEKEVTAEAEPSDAPKV